MVTNPEAVAAAMAHIADCEECQLWLAATLAAAEAS